MNTNLTVLILALLIGTGCSRSGSSHTPNTTSGDIPTCGATATIRWDRNTEADLAGYRVYMGLESGNYSTQIQISDPDTTTYTAADLNLGQTYYFVVTAYDFAGNESSRASEVSKTIFACALPKDVSKSY